MGKDCRQLWTSKGIDHVKVIIWKALMGALPTSAKAIRGIGSAVCKGCNASIEKMHHLFRDCPCISYAGIYICNWIFKIWGVRTLKVQFISNNWGKQTQVIVVCLFYLKKVWLARNERLFLNSREHIKVLELVQFCIWSFTNTQIYWNRSSEWNQF